MAAAPRSTTRFQNISISALLEGAPEPLDFPPMQKIPSTDYATFVLDTITYMTKNQPPGARAMNQDTLRRCLALASSFLITDSSMNPERGTTTWATGLGRLVDIILAMHKRDELEPATVAAASRACRECWTAAGSFKGIEECRGKVREIATKLRSIVDPNGKTYKGQSI